MIVKHTAQINQSFKTEDRGKRIPPVSDLRSYHRVVGKHVHNFGVLIQPEMTGALG